MNIKLGSDAEVFLSENGRLVSAYGILQGTKAEPFLVENGAAWQVDGMAAELNPPPASTEEEWLFSIKDVMAQLKASIPNHDVLIQPVAEFGQDYINKQPIEATELGCSADFNAWSGQTNPTPEDGQGIRTGGGHVHIGWTDDASEEANKGMAASLTKQLDFFLALPSLLFDTNQQRRSMYGKAGAFRTKRYGCEYRTLSNQWLSSDSLIKLVYNNTHKAIERLTRGDILEDRWGNIENVINNGDVNRALNIMDMEGIAYD